MNPATRRDAWTIASLAACGIVLGAVMTPLFAPSPKNPVVEPLQLSGRAQVPVLEETPAGMGTGMASLDGYVPSDAYDGPIWQYPAPAYEPWEPVSSSTQADASVSESDSTWEAADEAQAAAKDAAEAAVATSQPSETVRKTELANGLY